MTYNFGYSITRTFIPYENGEPINLPSQVPSIYLFSSQPSLADALAGTGAISAFTRDYWTEQLTTPYKRTYTYPPINDTASRSSGSVGYWEAVNFVLSGGGTTHTVLRQFDVERTETTDSYPTVTTDTLIEIYPAITSYLTTGQLTQFLGIALDDIKMRIRARGLVWTNLYQLQDLKLSLAYRTISLCALSQIKESGDRHEIRYNEFNKLFSESFTALTLEVDTNNDGEADEEVKPSPSYAIIIR